MKVEKEIEKKKVVNVLKKLNDVEAIAFFGNTAHGFEDKYSDIDIICFCKKIPSTQIREQEFKKLKLDSFIDNKQIPFLSNQADYFILNKVKIGLWYVLLTEYEKFVDKFQKGKVNQNEFLNVVAHVYYTKIAYDSKKVLYNLKKKIPRPKKENVKHFLQKLNRVVYESEWPYGEKIKFESARKNYLSVNAQILEFVNYYLICLFALNREFYTGPKWLSAHLNKFRIKPKNCINKLNQLGYLGNDGESVNKKMNILKYLVDDLNKRFKLR